VAREGSLTVLGDESVPGPGDVSREVLAGRCAAISLKVGRSGYLDADRIRGFCESAGVPILSGSQGESSVGTLACLAYAAAHPSTVRYPSELSYFLKLEADLLTEPLTVRDGRLAVPDRPGNGVEIDDRTLDRYRMSAS
jgi:L-alanine-DL-glutamate epimerase-like enolase superfamily enzyme